VHVVEAPRGMIDTAGLAESKLLPGGERWMKSAPHGKPEIAARRIIQALERGRKYVFYSRLLAPGYHFGILSRSFSARFARYADPDDQRLLVRGSQGTRENREVREAWEAEHGNRRRAA
jgi:hypothetical protein